MVNTNMSNTIALTGWSEKLKTAIIDILAISFVYFVPSISHLLSFPLYLIEPMRIMIVLAFVHTRKENAYILAFTLPAFSFLVSGHPNIFKAGLIAMELGLIVWFFFFLIGKISSNFVALLSSIILSKIVYYALKFIFISTALLNSELISTPLYLQFIMTFVFSIYVMYLFPKNHLNSRTDNE